VNDSALYYSVMDVDTEAHRLVAEHLEGRQSEADLRRALGDLLASSQVHIHAVMHLHRTSSTISIDYQDVAQKVLLRVWNRLQRTGDDAPFDIELFAHNRYSFLGWARANAKNAARSLLGEEIKSQALRLRAAEDYGRQQLERSQIDDHCDPVMRDVSAGHSILFDCFLIRREYSFPAPRGICDRAVRDTARNLISQLRSDYRNARSVMDEPVVQQALTHWHPNDYLRATRLPDRVLAAIMIEALGDRSSLVRYQRMYTIRLKEITRSVTK
jgi:hypothetical protein